jgi:FtsZ-binding cell division protein ZapB
MKSKASAIDSKVMRLSPHGLGVFQVSENAATVRASLESLMHSVGEAFLISGSAIGLAMLVTLFEKSLLNALYRCTDAITRAIDDGFESGVGEHYLGRLVRASEDSASQSKILKDALVEELGELLREVTEAQINASREHAEAARENNQALGATIAESIRQSLEGPLQDIASTVKTASGDQSASAVSLLQDVMSSFSERLNSLFGGQISGINQLNQQTASSMQEAVSTLQTLVANIEESSRRSADTMAERMADAIEKMEARQEAMNSQSSAFVEQIRALVANSQTETSSALQETLQKVGEQVGVMLDKLNTSQAQAFENSHAREQAANDRSSAAVTAMTESVESVVTELSAATAQMAKNVTVLTQTTSSSVERMHTGAEQLGLASRNFATAGERVTSVMSQAAGVTEKLAEISGALTVGGSAMQSLLKDYQGQRAAVETLVGELRATVESARKEASLTADILGRIESSAQKLGLAQKQADEYLDDVSQVLADAHTAFATEVKRTLNTANTEFLSKLSTAVNMLHAAIGELELTLSTAGVATR